MTGVLFDFLKICVPLLVVVDYAGTVPLFLAITQHQTERSRRRIARSASLVAASVGVGFFVIGQAIFSFLGIEIADFQIAGGLLLLVLTILDLLIPGKPTVDENVIRSDVDEHVTGSLFPLAVPLIVGPATLTTGLLLVSTYSQFYGRPLAVLMVSLSLVSILSVQLVLMYYSTAVLRVVGKQLMSVLNKIVMILLAAIAVHMIRAGVTTIVTGMMTK